MKKEKRQVKVNKSRNFAFLIVLFSFSFFIFNFALSTEADAATISKPMQSLGLVGYWSFDVGKGTAKAIDMSGKGNHGTLTNMNTTAAWVGGKIGNALNFDGSDDYVVKNGSSGLIFGTGAFTMSAWIKTSSTAQYNGIISQWNGGGAGTDSFRLVMYDDATVGGVAGKISFTITSLAVDTIISSSAVNDGNWHHIVAGRDSSDNLFLYIDGSSNQANSDTSSVSVSYSGTPFDIGRGYNGGWLFSGSIDEVRIYNRALSADEIKRLYRQTSPQMNASQANKLRQGLVGMWTFDGNDMGTTSAIDRSGNGNTGWLINGTKKTIGKIGQALNFDGSNDYVNIPNTSSINNLTEYTISAWVKLSQANNLYQRITNKSTNLRFEIRSGSILLASEDYTGTDAISWSNAVYTRDKWYHAVATFSESKDRIIHLYMDGNEITYASGGKVPSTGTIFSNNGSLTIGSNAGGADTNWNGLIDDVRVYNRALTPAEIRQLYKAGSSFHPNVTNKDSIRDGLVGHWSFDGADMGTTSARDASGAGNTGWLINGTKKAVGRIGQALNFDGVDDHVNAGSASSLDNITVKTLAAWIYPRTHGENNTGQIIQKEQNSNQWRLQIDNNSAACQGGGGQKICFRQQFSTMAGTWRSANNTVPLNTWTHVAVVYDRSSTANDPVFYINGVSVAITEQTTPSGDVADDNTLMTSIGATITGGSTFDGLIDEVRIYNRALSPAEIKRLYNMGR